MEHIQLILSEDGSHTLYNSVLDETYHSIHGAIQESKYIFIERGLQFFHETFPNEKPRILEIGFGTGLNVFLSAIWAEKNQKEIEFTSLEKFPLSKEITDELNYSKQIESDNFSSLFQNIHNANWNEFSQIGPFLQLKKVDLGIEDFETEGFNIIYFDAFAPSKQEEMWSQEIFEKVASLCEEGAVFVTYCAKGQVRRDLQSLGFAMERLPGPPGKLQMLRGILEAK